MKKTPTTSRLPPSQIPPSQILPQKLNTNLQKYFIGIQKEFELLYLEKCDLTEKLDALQQQLSDINSPAAAAAIDEDAAGGGGKKLKVPQQQPTTLQQKLLALRLKQQTHRLVSSFKNIPLKNIHVVSTFDGIHKDGIWDVCYRGLEAAGGLLGTASADHRSAIWSTTSTRCLLRYNGHTGSVNSIRFHPTRELVLTSSGDCTAHIWQGSVIEGWANDESKPPTTTTTTTSSDEDDPLPRDELTTPATLRTPSIVLNGHSSVVICADWVLNGEQLVTASWDRTAILWDTCTAQKLTTFTGHEAELTFTTAHPTQKLIVTTGKDCTFRLWDLRRNNSEVSVFQGHTDTITSTLFTHTNNLISSSDDRTIKIWDIRNLTKSTNTIRLDSTPNRLATHANLLAIPTDTCCFIYDWCSCSRVGRLAGCRRGVGAGGAGAGGAGRRRFRSNVNVGHRRMVTSVVWGNDDVVYSGGFDRCVIGWEVKVGGGGAGGGSEGGGGGAGVILVGE